MFKTETHIHTWPPSYCAKLGPRQVVRLHQEAGYDTLIISDHFAGYHFNKLGDQLTFAEKVDVMWNNYLEAKDEGDKLGIVVLFSVELSLAPNHYLLYNVTREFLCSREDVFRLSPEEFYGHAKAHGITIIQAHPYRDGKCVPCLDYVDGFEVFNTNPRHENYNEKTLELARKHGKLITCGGDVHRPEDLNRCAVLSEERITGIEQYLRLMREGKLTISVEGEAVCCSL